MNYRQESYHRFYPGDLVILGLGTHPDQQDTDFDGVGMVIEAATLPGSYTNDGQVYVLWPRGEVCMSDWEVEPLVDRA